MGGFDMQTNAIYILTVEAKDLYNANNLCNGNSVGYNIRTNGEINHRKFINTLNYSLDSIKLREVYEKVYRNKRFCFTRGKKEYTQHVINVNFVYSYKLFNKSGKNTFIRAGYGYKDIELKDGICVRDGVLAGIQVGVEVDSCIENTDLLEKCFVYVNGKYEQKGTIPCLMNKAELRKWLYINGFDCDGIHYVRFKRSSGSSRVGKCLFINERMYKSMHQWDLCGLHINKGNQVDLAGLESYIALTSSGIIDTLELYPENFLLIDDYNSKFMDDVVLVQYENDELTSGLSRAEVCNSIFDGQSLLDVSLFEKYATRGMLLLRNRFFKSACFNTNIQKWFAANGITNVKQLNGRTQAKTLDDIKIITTPSSIKYLKFGSFDQWLDNLDPTFGIVKHEKATHFFDGRMVQSHYQLLNTLQLSESDVHELLSPSFNYITQIRNDPDVLRYHIKYPDHELELSPMGNKNEIVYKLLGINNDFAKTQWYLEFRNDLIRSLIKRLKKGHLYINGNYSTLFGNPLEMLQQSIGTFGGQTTLGIGNIHSKWFSYGETILGSRSPHICSGNVLLVKNVEHSDIDRYFNLSNEVVCVNSINENIQQRLNGADYDSDTILLTNNQMLIERAKLHYEDFKVPTCSISAKKTDRYYTAEHQADLDIKTSVNKIGEIVNFSQQLNSLLWDNINTGQTLEENKDLYYDICKLAVLSGTEIDAAKREYALNTGKELAMMKEKYKIEDRDKVVKPMFFKMITTTNGYKLNPRHIYKYFETSMDYLQRQIGKFNFHNSRAPKPPIMPFSDLVKPLHLGGSKYYQAADRIVQLITDTKAQIDFIRSRSHDATSETINNNRKMIVNLQQECIEYISGISIAPTTAYLLLREMEDMKYSFLKNMLFTFLFSVENPVFYSLLKSKEEPLLHLEENEYGSIVLYDFRFIKQISKRQLN